MAYRVRVEGFNESLVNISERFGKLIEHAPAVYNKVVTDTINEARSKSVVNLNKPSWLLSKAMSEKVKLYKKGMYIFGVSGIRVVASNNKNSPENYGIYQEHGYYVDKNTIKNPNAKRIHKSGGYVVQKGKDFMKKAFREAKKNFENRIRDANLELEKTLERN